MLKKVFLIALMVNLIVLGQQVLSENLPQVSAEQVYVDSCKYGDIYIDTDSIYNYSSNKFSVNAMIGDNNKTYYFVYLPSYGAWYFGFQENGDAESISHDSLAKVIFKAANNYR